MVVMVSIDFVRGLELFFNGTPAASPECVETMTCAGRCGKPFEINANISCACDQELNVA